MVQKRIALVTGAGGFMGSRLVAMLKDTGNYSVIGTDLAAREGIPWDEFIPADLTKFADVERLLNTIDDLWGKIYVVFDVKGLFDYAATQDELIRVNVGGTKQLYELIHGANLRPRIVMWGAAGSYPFPTSPRAPM